MTWKFLSLNTENSFEEKALCVLERTQWVETLLITKNRNSTLFLQVHGDAIKWKHFPLYWHQAPVNSPHNGRWAFIYSFFFLFDLHLNQQLSKKQWRSRWCHCAHYGVTTMFSHLFPPTPNLPQSHSCHLLPASSHPVSACHCVNCQYLGNPRLSGDQWGAVLAERWTLDTGNTISPWVSAIKT